MRGLPLSMRKTKLARLLQPLALRDVT